MYRKVYPLFLLCETPLHAGSGSDLGIVDLPIQRERHTTFPKIEASSLKGGIREAFERKIHADIPDDDRYQSLDSNDTKIHRIFGYDDGSLNGLKEKLEARFKDENDGTKPQKDFAGAIGFSDARLLLFPIKSMKGVFAWVTCPKILSQFKSDIKLSELDSPNEINALLTTIETPRICSNSKLKLDNISKIVLEEYAFDVEESANLSKFGKWLSETIFVDLPDYWKNKVKTDIVILPDDDFKDFVNLSTEVITRTKIDNVTGTVAQGALFTEEYLPAESLLYALLLCAPEFRKDGMTNDEVFEFFNFHLPDLVQLGGNATLGKGIIRSTLLNRN